MGLNGVDNAKLTFSNVRVPRENLLNKHSDVDEKVMMIKNNPLSSPNGVGFFQGNFTSSISGGRSRFLTVADQLLSGRYCYYTYNVAVHNSQKWCPVMLTPFFSVGYVLSLLLLQLQMLY